MNEKAKLLLKYAATAPRNKEQRALFVEIGCIRHEIEDEDGWSTFYLGTYCQMECNPEIKFLSYDTNKEAVDAAWKVCREHFNPAIICKDGEKALKELADTNHFLSFLFLDSHKNPSFSFNQYKAAKLVPGAVVIIDDAQKIEEWDFGKADYVKKVFDKKKMSYEIIETVPGWKSFVAILPNGKKSGEL